MEKHQVWFLGRGPARSEEVEIEATQTFRSALAPKLVPNETWGQLYRAQAIPVGECHSPDSSGLADDEFLLLVSAEAPDPLSPPEVVLPAWVKAREEILWGNLDPQTLPVGVRIRVELSFLMDWTRETFMDMKANLPRVPKHRTRRVIVALCLLLIFLLVPPIQQAMGWVQGPAAPVRGESTPTVESRAARSGASAAAQTEALSAAPAPRDEAAQDGGTVETGSRSQTPSAREFVGPMKPSEDFRANVSQEPEAEQVPVTLKEGAEEPDPGQAALPPVKTAEIPGVADADVEEDLGNLDTPQLLQLEESLRIQWQEVRRLGRKFQEVDLLMDLIDVAKRLDHPYTVRGAQSRLRELERMASRARQTRLGARITKGST